MVFGIYLAGLLATLVMTIVIVMGGPMMGLMPKNWNMITDGLGGMANKMMGVPKSMGYGIHFLVGTVFHPLIFDIVWIKGLNLIGGYLGFTLYALIFASMMVAMLGMLNAPSDWRSKIAMGAFIAHIVYAVVYVFSIGLSVISAL